ncbi:LysR substrate-binding domain-containing protein [Dyella sp. 20L07]|uniref:LysR substrate-binding domain-containing protein n=1 Tax=Dyella sp. 20L07 TaxID=3384240 RepID=UPI003D2E264C
MLDLNDFYYFVQVVDRGGFTSAERTLRIPKSTLSGRVQRLERDLGVRLLNRTSRRFGVTEAGKEFYQHAVGMLQRAEQAESVIRQRLSEPSGTVRVTAAVITAQFAMSKMVSDFIQKHPKVNVVQHATNRNVDLIGENFDVAIRAHTTPLPDSSLVQRTLAPAPWYLFAGTAYLDRAGTPRTPQDLAQHASLFMMRSGVAPAWHLSRPVAGAREELTLPLSPRLLSDDIISLKQAALDGLGIVALPGYTCCDELRAGNMSRVLPDWQAGDSTITALIPDRHGMLPAVRAFVDHLVAEFPKAVAL